MRYLLAALLLLFPSWSWAAEPHPVCSVADFGDFIKQFGALSRAEQDTCVKYPVKELGGKKTFRSLSSLDAYHFGGSPLVRGPDNFIKQERANPLYVAGDHNKLQAGRYGYVYQGTAEGMELRLVLGHDPYVYEGVKFEYLKGTWRLTGVTGDEAEN